jgi:hypothetical protein
MKKIILFVLAALCANATFAQRTKAKPQHRPSPNTEKGRNTNNHWYNR